MTLSPSFIEIYSSKITYHVPKTQQIRNIKIEGQRAQETAYAKGMCTTVNTDSNQSQKDEIKLKWTTQKIQQPEVI